MKHVLILPIACVYLETPLQPQYLGFKVPKNSHLQKLLNHQLSNGRGEVFRLDHVSKLLRKLVGKHDDPSYTPLPASILITYMLVVNIMNYEGKIISRNSCTIVQHLIPR